MNTNVILTNEAYTHNLILPIQNKSLV